VRLIFVNRYFHPDFSATSQMLSDLAFSMVREQWPVTVITSRQIYDDPLARLPPFEAIDGVDVRRVATTAYGRARSPGRLIDYLSFHAAATLELLKVARRGDIVIAMTDPPLISVPAWLAARVKRAVLVNWLQDLFPEVLHCLTPGTGSTRRLTSILRLLRNGSLRAAARNVAVGRLMARRLTQERIGPEAVRVIENWADGTTIAPVSAEANELRRAWQLGDQLVVGYSGNLGRVHEFETILDAAERLQGREDVIFLFIGGGARLPWLKNEVLARGLRNVQFRPYQDRALLASSLSVPDIHLVCLREEMEGLVVPSKFYGALAAGRPCLFVGAADGELAAAIRDLRCGFAVPSGDGAALASVIGTLAADRELVHNLGRAARVTFDERFDRSLAVHKWVALLSELRPRLKVDRPPSSGPAA
jgi:glycosyltransferase involved in cell wall biosynthesis